jgi:hypothetical protein
VRALQAEEAWVTRARSRARIVSSGNSGNAGSH